MDRISRPGRQRLAYLTAAGVLLCLGGGCMQIIPAVAYLIKGTNTAAEFDGLKGKRVAVVCRPSTELQYASGNVANELAAELGLALQQKIKKIEVIEADRVAEWADEHSWDEFVEVGKALDADMVVAIELRDFRLKQAVTLYKGIASMGVKVYDVADGGKVVFQKEMPEFSDPPNAGISTSEMHEADFRRRFVGVVAERIGRYFYGYDYTREFARDADALQ